MRLQAGVVAVNFLVGDVHEQEAPRSCVPGGRIAQPALRLQLHLHNAGWVHHQRNLLSWHDHALRPDEEEATLSPHHPPA